MIRILFTILLFCSSIDADAGFLTSYALGFPTSVSVGSFAGAALGRSDTTEPTENNHGPSAYLRVDGFVSSQTSINTKIVFQNKTDTHYIGSYRGQLLLNENESTILRYEWFDEISERKFSHQLTENEIFNAKFFSYDDFLTITPESTTTKTLPGFGFGFDEKIYRIPTIDIRYISGDDVQLAIRQDILGLEIKNLSSSPVDMLFGIYVNKNGQRIDVNLVSSELENRMVLEKRESSDRVTLILLFVIGSWVGFVLIRGLFRHNEGV